jgi:glycogen synthase
MTTDTVGGVFDYAVELSRLLARRGIDVRLATMGEPLRPGQARHLAAIDGLEVFESRFKLEWMDEPWRDVDEAGEWLLGLEELTRPDVVHLNGYAHGALPWRAPCLVVGHSCVLSWWHAVLGEPVPDRLNEYRRRVRRGLAGASMIVAPSESMLRSLGENYGAIANGRVIPNGRDFRFFSPGVKEPFIFSMGRLWDDAKNVRLTDQAAADLPWPVMVAGNAAQDGTASDKAPRRLQHARSLGLLEPEAVRNTLARASIYVHPARYEPFGLAVLEAALAGCALVLGDIPSLRELWGDAAIFVRVDDAAHLAREVTRLITDAHRRVALGARARRTASTYTPERMAASYLATYRQMRSASIASQVEEKSACA